MERNPQSYANHAKFDPPLHFVLLPLSLGLVIWAVWAALAEGTGHSWWRVVLSIVVLVLAFKTRSYALKVQDRVIRLEERMRMDRLLPETLRAQVAQLTESQLIGLRFASDAELPALVQRSLADQLSTKQIKQSVQNWRPDYFRV